MLLGVDTGGTFTDFVLLDAAGLRLHKVLSTPEDPSLRDPLAESPTSDSTTRRCGGTPRRSCTAAPSPRTQPSKAKGYAPRTSPIAGSPTCCGSAARRDAISTASPRPSAEPRSGRIADRHGRTHRATTATVIDPLTDADLEELRRTIMALRPEAVAINLLFSYVDDSHERAIESALEDLAFVSRSSDVLARVQGVRTRHRDLAERVARTRRCAISARGCRKSMAPSTRRRDAVIRRHDRRRAGAAAAPSTCCCPDPRAVSPLPATSARRSGARDLLTFDMGGTSTDVSLIGATSEHHAMKARSDPYPVAVPMADIHTIASGGGSIAYLDDGRRAARRPAIGRRQRRVPRATGAAAPNQQ